MAPITAPRPAPIPTFVASFFVLALASKVRIAVCRATLSSPADRFTSCRDMAARPWTRPERSTCDTFPSSTLPRGTATFPSTRISWSRMARKLSPERLIEESSGSWSLTWSGVPAGITAYRISGALGAGGASWTLACGTGSGSAGTGSSGAGAGGLAAALRGAGATLAGSGALGAGAATGAGSGGGAGTGAGATTGSGAAGASCALSFLFLLHPAAASSASARNVIFTLLMNSSAEKRVRRTIPCETLDAPPLREFQIQPYLPFRRRPAYGRRIPRPGGFPYARPGKGPRRPDRPAAPRKLLHPFRRSIVVSRRTIAGTLSVRRPYRFLAEESEVLLWSSKC